MSIRYKLLIFILIISFIKLYATKSGKMSPKQKDKRFCGVDQEKYPKVTIPKRTEIRRQLQSTEPRPINVYFFTPILENFYSDYMIPYDKEELKNILNDINNVLKKLITVKYPLTGNLKIESSIFDKIDKKDFYNDTLYNPGVEADLFIILLLDEYGNYESTSQVLLRDERYIQNNNRPIIASISYTFQLYFDWNLLL